MRRLNRGVLAAVTVLVLASGCFAVPQPVSEVEPPVPAMTVEQAGALRKRTLAVVAKAVKAEDRRALQSVLTGPDLSVKQAVIQRHRRFGRPLYDDNWRAGTVVAVSTSAAERYPRTSLVVTKLTQSTDDGADRMLEVFQRRSAATGWLRASTVAVKERELPKLPLANAGVTAPAPGVVNGYRIRESDQLAEALRKPTSKTGTRFAASSNLAYWSGLAARREKESGEGFTSRAAFSGSDSYGFATEGGGALVLAAIDYVRTDTANDDSEEDRWYTFEKDSELASTFKDKYSSVTDSHLLIAMLYVPPRGKLQTVTVWNWPVDTYVTPDTGA